jgi:hypothetical protein
MYDASSQSTPRLRKPLYRIDSADFNERLPKRKENDDRIPKMSKLSRHIVNKSGLIHINNSSINELAVLRQSNEIKM